MGPRLSFLTLGCVLRCSQAEQFAGLLQLGCAPPAMSACDASSPTPGCACLPGRWSVQCGSCPALLHCAWLTQTGLREKCTGSEGVLARQLKGRKGPRRKGVQRSRSPAVVIQSMPWSALAADPAASSSRLAALGVILEAAGVPAVVVRVEGAAAWEAVGEENDVAGLAAAAAAEKPQPAAEG